MKNKVREMSVALGVGVICLAWGTGCETSRAKAESTQNPPAVQVFTNSAAPTPTASAPVIVAEPVAVVTPAAAAPTSPSGTPPASAAEVARSNSVQPAPTAPGTDGATAADAPVVQEATVPAQMNLSPALTQVVKLIQGGVSSEVVMAYVTNSTELFNVGSNEILYLHDLGAPAPVITALIQKDSTPEAQAKRQALGASLPAGIALHSPATNVYPETSGQPGVSNPPEPTPVAPPTSLQAAAPAPAATAVPVPGGQPSQPVSTTYFESELSPYGSWVYVSGYGRCWRPTVSVWNGGWRPYVDGGRWLWTDSGWYWYSDYSWGWAPFHYGRWFCPPGVGWVWYPDVHWGPAWVSWRHSRSYCGWAPLPPAARWVHGHGFYHHSASVGFGFEFGLGFSDYVFVSYDRFCDRRPGGYLVTSHHARSVYNETKVVNNYTFKNNTIINHGAGVEPVNAMTRGTVKKVALRDTANFRDVSGRRERLEADGQSLSVTRPSAAVLAARSPVTGAARPTTGTFGGSRFSSGSAAGAIVPGGSARENSSSVRPTSPIRREGAGAGARVGGDTSGRGSPGSNSRFERPYARPANITPPVTPGTQGGQGTRPFTTRPSTREPSVVAGGSSPPPATPSSRPGSGLSGAPSVPPSPSTPAPSIARPGGSSSVPRAGVGARAEMPARVVPPSSTPSPRESIRVSPPVSSGNNPSVITRPAPSRPSYDSGGGRRIESSPRSQPAPRVESSRPAPSRSDSSPRNSGNSGGNNGGGGRGRGRD